jgi:hypothetical protein
MLGRNSSATLRIAGTLHRASSSHTSSPQPALDYLLSTIGRGNDRFVSFPSLISRFAERATGKHLLAVNLVLGGASSVRAAPPSEAACRVPTKLRIGGFAILNSGLTGARLEILDRIDVSWQPPGGGAAISGDTLITGMEWRSREKTVTLVLKTIPSS